MVKCRKILPSQFSKKNWGSGKFFVSYLNVQINKVNSHGARGMCSLSNLMKVKTSLRQQTPFLCLQKLQPWSLGQILSQLTDSKMNEWFVTLVIPQHIMRLHCHQLHTTKLFLFQVGEVVTTIPTIGFNVEQVTYKNLKFQVWDLGGQTSIRYCYLLVNISSLIITCLLLQFQVFKQQ